MANKRLSAVITIGGAVSSTLGAAFGAVRSQTSQVGAAVSQLTARQKELNRELEKIGRSGQRGSELRVQYAQQELVTIGRQIEALKRRQAIENAQKANRDQRSELRGKIGETVAVGAVVAAPTAMSIKTAADFNYQLRVIGNTANMTQPQIKALGDEILKISGETGNSAQNVQKAMGFLVAAGMEAGTAAAVLRPVGRTATATASEIEDVAKATFTLNDALKIQPTQMQRALDMLVQSGKEGNFEFKDMASELPVLAAGMQSLKMTGGEAVATLGAALQIARKGAGTSQQASTNVENFLAKVMSPETLKKASKTFGVDLYKIISDAQKNGKNPFEAAIQAINKMTKGGDQKLLGELFQDMQVQNFLRPMLQNLQEYDRIKKAALAADGVTDRDLPGIMAETKKQMDSASEAVGRLGIALGTALAPAVGAVLGVFTPLVERLTTFVTENSAVVGSVVAATTAFFVGRTAFLALNYGVKLVTAGFWALRAIMLANPIGLVVGAIAASVALIYLNWGPLKEWFKALWDDIKASFAAVYDWIVGKVAYMMELPGKIKQKVASVFSGGGSDLGSIQYDANGIPTGMSLPDVPAMTPRSGSNVTDNSQTTINITQQPGQDAKGLADELERRRRLQAGVRARSSLVDGAGAQ